jgi:hypothetical protein
LNISTYLISLAIHLKRRHTGEAKTAFTAPAIDPAKATCGTVKSGYGDTKRLEAPYAVNRRELTAAIPINGDACPLAQIQVLLDTLTIPTRSAESISLAHPYIALKHPPS